MSNEKEIQKYLEGLPDKARDALSDAIEEEADGLASTIRSKAPRKTGTLAGTVRVRKKDDLTFFVEAGGSETTKEIRAGSGVYTDYALHVEFGTQKTPAEPFFYPTARAERREIDRNIEKAIEEALK